MAGADQTDHAANPVRLYIAIDGTAGSGKTTIGQQIARTIGCVYLDTGAMYRAVTLLGLRQGAVSPDHADADALAGIAAQLDFRTEDAAPGDGRQYTVVVFGEDVSLALHSDAVNGCVSTVAAIPTVRVVLVEQQRAAARRAGRIVMMGRDIGSVVLPDADLKIFLDGDPAVRAARRFQDMQNTGTDVAAVQASLLRRDSLDSTRAAAPLVVPPGALVVHTDDKTIAQTLALIMAELRRRVPTL